MPAPTHLPTRAPVRAPTRGPVQTPVVEPDADEEVRRDPSSGDGEHDRFAHYVSRRELEKAKRKGTAVTALCGKRWKPDGDPSRYPMCPTCAEMAAERIADSFGS